MRYTCIYCKEEKDEKEFNREHVLQLALELMWSLRSSSIFSRYR